MDVIAVIIQLKAYAPIFDGRVAGLVEFNQSSMGQLRPEQFPAAYVVPLSEEAEPNDVDNALYQPVTKNIGIVVEFDNTADRRGQSVTEAYDGVKSAIDAAVLNWRGMDPDHAQRGMEYVRAEVVAWDNARVYYRFEYSLLTLLTEADGFQVDVPYLLEIDANSDEGDPPPGFKYVAPPPPS